MRTPALMIAAGLVCGLSVLTTAQTSQQTPPTFRGRVDLVPLDVSVWDMDGRPVKGLTADKFTLFEDNTPREIVTFAAVDIPDPPAPTAAWMRDAFVDVATNDIEGKRLFLILFDDASFGSSTVRPSFKERIKSIVRTAIRHLGPTDLAAIVFTGDNRRSQDFTADHGRLLAATEQMQGVTMPSFLAQRYSVTVLERAVESLLKAPGRRKALLDITSMGGDWQRLMREDGHLITRTEAMFEKAQRAGVNVYMMGLRAPAERPLTEEDRAYWEGDWFRRVAHETGGQWYANLGDDRVVEAAVTQVFQANSSYYILGYSSADIRKFHFIKVLVDVPGAEVRAREKYYWPEAEKVESGPPPPPLAKSISGVLPDAGIPMHATAAAFASRDGREAVIAAVTKVRITASGAAASSLETFAFSTRAFTAQGDARGETMTEPTVRHLGRDADTDTEVFSQVRIEKPGLYEVRLAAHRPGPDLNGSVYLTVDVPDFDTLPVALSGVVLSTSPWPVFGLKDDMAVLMPVRPTIDREFARGQRVRAFVRVYQRGSRPAARTVRVHVIDAHEQRVFERIEQLPPARFAAAGGADLIVDVPLTTLAPGPYLLVFESSAEKTTARREVRFRVK